MNVVAANASAYWTSHPTLARGISSQSPTPSSLRRCSTASTSGARPRPTSRSAAAATACFAHDWRTEPGRAVAAGAEGRTRFAIRRGGGGGARAAAAAGAVAGRFRRGGPPGAARLRARRRAGPQPLAAHAAAAGCDAAAPARAAALRALVREAAGTLEGTPKDRKLHDAIWHTYLQPTATQEQAAELLNLPFNTYRYRLRARHRAHHRVAVASRDRGSLSALFGHRFGTVSSGAGRHRFRH